MLRQILILTVIIFSASFAEGETEPAAIVLRDGDIIFQESVSSQGTELKLATKSRYTHMGIIRKSGGKYFVLEAVYPVSVTPLQKFIARGKNRHYVIKRLKDAKHLLTPDVLNKMEETGRGFIGKKYDPLFQWSDDRIYCSELVWKIYKRATGIEIGELQKYRDFDLSHPKVKALIKKRFGNREIPLDETVISPVQMFNSPMLVTVAEVR
jgi:hypothetical protein